MKPGPALKAGEQRVQYVRQAAEAALYCNSAHQILLLLMSKFNRLSDEQIAVAMCGRPELQGCAIEDIATLVGSFRTKSAQLYEQEMAVLQVTTKLKISNDN